MTKQSSTGSIGADTTTSNIFNNAALTHDVKDRYLDEGNPNIQMTGDAVKPPNTGISYPSDPSETNQNGPRILYVASSYWGLSINRGWHLFLTHPNIFCKRQTVCIHHAFL